MIRRVIWLLAGLAVTTGTLRAADLTPVGSSGGRVGLSGGRIGSSGDRVGIAEGRVDSSGDRVGFPADYRRWPVLRTANITQQAQLGTIYGNAQAASIHDAGTLPYPNGSVLVMEWATPRKGADGASVTGAGGLWEKGEVVRIDVMRREAGYGAAYGDKRAGEWEFASYTPDGRPFAPAIDAGACAACHAKPGVARDFVFRGRFPALAVR